MNKKVKRKKLTKWEAECIYENLKPTLDYKDLKNSGLVIEAVPEILDLKHRIGWKRYFFHLEFDDLRFFPIPPFFISLPLKRIIKEVEAHAPADAIFATNTSGLLVEEIAKAHSKFGFKF